MGDVRAILKKAVAFHQSGDLNSAEPLYRKALSTQPDDRETRYLLGTLRLQQGEFAECITLLESIAADSKDVPDVHNNLGVAYKTLGRWEDAAKSFQAAITANPDYDQAFFNLGAVMEDRGLFSDAEKCYARAHDLNPSDDRTAMRLGNVLSILEKWTDAEQCYRDAIERSPQNPDLHVSLGYVLLKQERLDEVEKIYREVLILKPNFHQVQNSLSYLYERQGRLEEAVREAKRSLEIQPNYAEAYNNLGIALRSQHRLDEACQQFQEALELRPIFALAEFNLGTTHLLKGDYRKGWGGYHRHAETLGEPPREFSVPRWDDSTIAGKTLLVYADQGFGDTIQFVRFLDRAKQDSQATIVLECSASLTRLLVGQCPAEKVVAEGEALPAFDFQIPLSDLPGLFGVEVDTVPLADSYLRSQEPIRDELNSLLDSDSPSNFKVGLVWQGNPRQARDNVRSCSLETLEPLLDLPGVRFFSLQTDELGQNQIAKRTSPPHVIDLGSKLRDFTDTAAVIERLDLLITVDTAVAHLAGALGSPVWTLLCHTPDWRWHLGREDSPWYASMRLFRQPTWGDWDSVIENVQAALEKQVGNAT